MYDILTIINFILLIYILFRMRDYNQLVKDKKWQDFLKKESNKQESWEEVVKFFGSEKKAREHYGEEFFDNLDRAYKLHLEHGGDPIEGHDDMIEKKHL